MSTKTLERQQVQHLNHMTDGFWHDDCRWCLLRRVHSGNGLVPKDGCTCSYCYWVRRDDALEANRE